MRPVPIGNTPPSCSVLPPFLSSHSHTCGYPLPPSIPSRAFHPERLKHLSGSRTCVQTNAPRRDLNCNTASICKIHRVTYARTYPTIVVLPDSSSVNIRYHEPRKIIKLPLDLSTLTEEERKERLERRKPKKKVTIIEEIADNFDASKYIKLIKK
uniref:Ribosomal protein L55 n=1 Tax=Timema douglasi TaxID=61478 RepID=A0A7R8VVL9_TIMDO|nr:unnamed protein product [Timema douglasi]